MQYSLVARQKLRKLEREGDVSSCEVKKFMDGVRRFFEVATKYILDKFPLNDETLKHAKLVDFERRESADISDVEYFSDCYSTFLKFTPQEQDALHNEFVEYQLLEAADIPQEVWRVAKQTEYEDGDTEEQQPQHVRIDVIWAFLSKKKSPDGCRLQFAYLARIAHVILVLPHSNAGEERVFSLVHLNKTSYRSRLSLDGTLSSILTVKMHNPEPCYRFDPPNRMLEDSKKATRLYNEQHHK